MHRLWSVFHLMTMSIYPLLFKPNLHHTIWGGTGIVAYKGLPDETQPVGESWEVSAVPSSPSIVSNGSYKGKDLISVVNELKESLLGDAVMKEYNGVLPLLVKIINAEKDLSIQVHPNDKLAMKRHNCFGKTEMWYIIDAQPGARLYAGFKKQVTETEYRRRVADGTICDILAEHPVKRGDVFYIPAGRVHAIGAGITLAEVQQSSDVTYRIYDYGRKGLDGKPRELHTEQAVSAIDFRVEEDYRTYYEDTDDKAAKVIDTEYFDVRVMDIKEPFHRNLKKYDSFIISMCMEGACTVRIRESIEEEQEIHLNEGWSCLIPASIADYDIIPQGNKTLRVLETHIDRKDRSMMRKITRFLHITT